MASVIAPNMALLIWFRGLFGSDKYIRYRAFWEDRGRGFGVIRVGRYADRPGAAYEFSLLADELPGPHIELIGLAAAFRREHHDAIGLCLLEQGFRWWQRKRYKKGVEIPMLPLRVHISSTFMKELTMSIDAAHAHSVHVFEVTIEHATKKGLTALVAALQVTAQACEDGIPAAKGASLGAQGDAVAKIMHTFDDVVAAAIPIPNDDHIHGDILNLYNSIRNVMNAVEQANLARMNEHRSK